MLNYGSAGSGGIPHLTMELFKFRAGINLSHVPFRGAGPMLVGSRAGRLEAGCDNIPSGIGHVRDGRLRALAVTGADARPALPEVPTVAESGLPGVRGDLLVRRPGPGPAAAADHRPAGRGDRCR